MLFPYFCNPNYCDSRLKDHLLIGKTWVKKTCIFLQSYILEIVYLYVYNSYTRIRHRLQLLFPAFLFDCHLGSSILQS